MKAKCRKLSLILIANLILVGCSQYKVKPVNSLIYYCIAEECSNMGMIEGVARQTPLVGDYTSEVTALAYDGFVFVKWNDDNFNATRSDLSTEVPFVSHVAYFEAINE